MNGEELAWLVLRVAYAWIFLAPIRGLLKNWPGTVSNTRLLFPWRPEWFACASLMVMIAGSFSILFDVYIRIGALGLLIFCLGGASIHFRLAKTAQNTALSARASVEDQRTVEQLKTLATVGHVTSAQKNYVLAAVALFILLQGIVLS